MKTSTTVLNFRWYEIIALIGLFVMLFGLLIIGLRVSAAAMNAEAEASLVGWRE